MNTTDIFRITAPAAEDFAAFHAEGYVAFPAVLSDAGLAGLTDVILNRQNQSEKHSYLILKWIKLSNDSSLSIMILFNIRSGFIL